MSRESNLLTSIQLIAKKATKEFPSKDNLGIFQAKNRRIFKNSQLQTNSSGSNKKRV